MSHNEKTCVNCTGEMPDRSDKAMAHSWKDAEAGRCDACGLTRAWAGPWFEYSRGAAYFGIISPTPPCDPLWPHTRDLRPSEATPRCSLCGSTRIVKNGRAGVCSLVPGRDGKGGCPDPLHDVRAEERSAEAIPSGFARKFVEDAIERLIGLYGEPSIGDLYAREGVSIGHAAILDLRIALANESQQRVSENSPPELLTFDEALARELDNPRKYAGVDRSTGGSPKEWSTAQLRALHDHTINDASLSWRDKLIAFCRVWLGMRPRVSAEELADLLLETRADEAEHQRRERATPEWLTALVADLQHEANDLQESLRVGRDYHGSHKHSSDWHQGYEVCAKQMLDELRRILGTVPSPSSGPGEKA